MLRSSIAVIFLALYILLMGPPLILHCLLTGSPEVMFKCAVAGARFAMVICGIKVKAEGLENIPPGVCIFVANHTSNADPPAVVGSIPRRVAMLGKKEVFRVPILGTVLRLAGFVAVDRANREAAIASVDQAIEHLKGGVSFLIFPEGTRSPDGRLRPFKKGSFVMAIRTQVPVVPVSVSGAHKVMLKGEQAVHPGIVTVKFHPPVEVNGYMLEHRDELIAKVQAIVASGLPEDQQPLAATTNADSSLRSE
ncbi:MAG: 1-acyl-sn-glycerol-3-phosphate acyltransferase [Acidobacteria bacterium]|nr:1-acyl-sn-glycerol-3-phosphate acyltransferase [Acidobacteriota bacterium]MCL5288277.1 1-acyl-sn-glycerol-3-phosphate acyltransferase [Acidobacteriota bacterium]